MVLIALGSLLCSIDCAGILKLRNADIELRKGETDIGRKNTRVRLVFRVHVPEPSGRIVSLQAASNPIECCKSGLGEGPHVSIHPGLVAYRNPQVCGDPKGRQCTWEVLTSASVCLWRVLSGNKDIEQVMELRGVGGFV